MTPSEAPELMLLLRAVRSLLALTACLLALLVLGLGVGAWYGVARLAQLEASALAQAEAWRGFSAAFGQEATRHQAGLSAGLVDRSRSTKDGLAALQERRRSLSGHPADPLAKADRMIDLTLLMSDQMFLLLRHMVDTQATVGKSLQPSAEQRKPMRSGSAP